MQPDAMNALATAHGRLWYAEPGYRLAWLAMPQIGTLVLAGLLLTLAARGEWARPATGSRLHVAELEALRDRAGKEGDGKALADLKAAAEGGDIDAATRLATLYDPLLAPSFTRKTVPSDLGRAAALYRAGGEAGDRLAMGRLGDLLLDPSNPNVDWRNGCRLAVAWLDHPMTTRDMIRGEERLAEKIARCLVEEESGLAPDPARAGALVVDTLRLKYEPSIRRYVRTLGLQKPAMIRGLQQAMAGRTVGRYTGPVDGIVHPETIEALEREAGLRPFPVMPPEAAPSITPSLSDEAFRSLAQAARRDAGALAQVQAIAETGNPTALATLGYLYSPFLNKGEFFAPDARRAAGNFERAAAGGERTAAAQAAGLYDKGVGNLAKDPVRAAALMLRQLDINPDYELIVTDPEIGAGWSPAFWGALQKELSTRGFYTHPIENRRNEAVIAAIRRMISAGSATRSSSRP